MMVRLYMLPDSIESFYKGIQVHVTTEPRSGWVEVELHHKEFEFVKTYRNYYYIKRVPWYRRIFGKRHKDPKN